MSEGLRTRTGRRARERDEPQRHEGPKVAPIHRAQVISYLKALGFPLGLLLNFKAETLRDGIVRIVR